MTQLTCNDVAALRLLRQANFVEFKEKLRELNRGLFLTVVLSIQMLRALHVSDDIINSEFKVYAPSFDDRIFVTSALSMAICSGYDHIVHYLLSLYVCKPTIQDMILVLNIGTIGMLKMVIRKHPDLIYFKIQHIGSAPLVLASTVRNTNRNIRFENINDESDDESLDIFNIEDIKKNLDTLDNAAYPYMMFIL